jgi:hypothetical protein
LPGQADIGWNNLLGWYEGFHLLMAVHPQGIITGFGVGPASAKDQPRAETFFALRRQPRAGRARALVARSWGAGHLPAEAQ